MMADRQGSEQVRKQARAWLLQLHGEKGEDPALRARFRAWVLQDAAHARAYAELEAVHRRMGEAALAAGVDVDALLAPPWPRRALDAFRRCIRHPALPGGLAGMAAAAILVVVLSPSPPVQDIPLAAPSYETAIAELQTVTLEDGSEVTLGADTRIETVFSPTDRRITLVSGEAFFDVRSDPDRPFYVAAQDTMVRVLGTQFDVRHGAGRIHVAVLEGVVEVYKAAPAGDAAERRRLTAGERVTVAHVGALPQVEVVDRVEPGAWRTGRLVYDDASLAEIIADANRHHPGAIRLASPDLAQIRLTTAFRTHEIELMLETLEASQPVRIERTSRGEIIIHPKR